MHLGCGGRYAHDDVGLTAVRAFLQEYEAAKAQLMAMITAVQTSREVDHLETQMGTWTYAPRAFRASGRSFFSTQK